MFKGVSGVREELRLLGMDNSTARLEDVSVITFTITPFRAWLSFSSSGDKGSVDVRRLRRWPEGVPSNGVIGVISVMFVMFVCIGDWSVMFRPGDCCVDEGEKEEAIVPKKLVDVLSGVPPGLWEEDMGEFPARGFIIIPIDEDRDALLLLLLLLLLLVLLVLEAYGFSRY
jgi:hypothetical protein